MILSYILHGNIPFYDESSPHPDPILHEKLLRSKHDLLSFDIDTLVEHFSASRFSYSTQALPVNVLLDTLVRPLGETDDAQKKTCVKWQHDPARIVPHVVIGQTNTAGGQWEENPVHASWDIATLSYAGMISLPGYGFDEHYQRCNGEPMPIYLRPSRRAVAEYFAAYPDQVGISGSVHNGEKVTGVSRHADGFYIASHKIQCKHLVMASGIFDELIQPPPLLRPLVTLLDKQSNTCSDPLLVIGSGFSAADVIISAVACQKIIHVFKWAPSTSPSPLRACHQQAYAEYAGVYRRMKLAALSSSQQTPEKRPKTRHSFSNFDLSRDWTATYEGLPNTEILDVQQTDDGAGALVTFQMPNGRPVRRRVCGMAYVIGRRGSLDYLSPTLLQEVLPAEDTRRSDSTVSGQTLREKANDDFEVASGVFAIGSLTGDSLIRFAYGGCAFTAGKIMASASPTISASTSNSNSNSNTSPASLSSPPSPSKKAIAAAPPRTPERNGVKGVSLRESAVAGVVSRFQTPTSSPKIPAMNGLDGHEASPISLAEKHVPLDRRKEA